MEWLLVIIKTWAGGPFQVQILFRLKCLKQKKKKRNWPIYCCPVLLFIRLTSYIVVLIQQSFETVYQSIYVRAVTPIRCYRDYVLLMHHLHFINV